MKILSAISGLLPLIAFACHASSACSPDIAKINKGKFSYLVFDSGASVKLVGEIGGVSDSYCAYSYMRHWGVDHGRVSKRLLITDMHGRLLGTYTIDVLKYMGVSRNKLVAINMENKKESINVVTYYGLAKSIFFDGEVYPLIMNKK